jgi:ketosteroid isomerase-like protein
MKRFVVAAMVAFVAMPLCNFKRVHADTDVERAVMNAQRRWEEALKQFDLQSLQSLLAEDYSQTDLRGEVQDRASWLEYFKSVVAAVHSGDAVEVSFEDTKVRAYGNVAVVTGGFTARGQRKGAPLDNAARFTNVWVKRRDAWQLVSYQATPVDTQSRTNADIFRQAVGVWERGTGVADLDQFITTDYRGHTASGDRDRDGLQKRIEAFGTKYSNIHTKLHLETGSHPVSRHR